MKHCHIFLITICILFASLAAQAQQPAPVVRQIDVQYAGSSTVSRERIIANMRTKVGKPYSEQSIEEDVRNLYAMGNINNVRIFGEPVRDGVKVVVVVQTKSKLSGVTLNGVTQLKASSLRKQLVVKPGEPLNEANMEADRQKILEEYRKKGFTDTRVEYKVDTDQKTGVTNVAYTVVEGGKSVIGAVKFEGNEMFSNKVLMKQIKTRPWNLLAFMTKAGQLANDQLDQDVQALRDYYQNHGYLDADVAPPDTQRLNGDRVAVVFHIKEGRQYHVGKVSISGARVFTTEEVRLVTKTGEGAVFSPEGLRNDVKAIHDLYGAKGYIDLQANPETSTGGAGLVNVHFKLDEGTQSYVERVNIENNAHTKDKVIRRELAVAPGEVYNSVLIEKSKQRLDNLNYFSRVETFPSVTDVPGRKDLNVLVEEKKTGSFNFGAGFSSIDSLIGFAEIQQSNFDITNWHGFTGGGQRFRIRGQYGTQRKDFILSLVEPWFLDYQLAVGGELFYNEASFVSTEYSQHDYGFALNVRKPIGPFTSIHFDYKLEEIGISHVSNTASPEIKSQEGDQLKSSIAAGITHDTRDSIFLTRRGHRIDALAYVAGGPLGGQENIYGFSVEGTQYFHLPLDMIFLVNGEIAGVSSYGSSSNVPIWDRLYLGGANNLRGYAFRMAGPKDSNGQPLGGNSKAHLTTELTFPIIERVRGAVFYDTGVDNIPSWNYSTTPLWSDVGLGVRIDLPIGPVRLDYGFPLHHDEHTNSTGKFNFTIGYQF